jgi:N-carbamoylputrescine amidase
MSIAKKEIVRPYTVAAISNGPNGDNKEKNLQRYVDLIDKTAKEKKPELIVLGELFATKFFPSAVDKTFFDRFAEPIDGATFRGFARKAREYGCYIVGGFFERSKIEGEYYNSVIVVGPNGDLVRGVLPDGRRVDCYRICQIPLIASPIESYEKLYFKPGVGFPVFDLGKTKVGIIVCYDMYYPEGPRSMCLQGAEMILVPTSARFPLDDRFIAMIRGIAASNQLYVTFANKAGTEERAASSGRHSKTSARARSWAAAAPSPSSSPSSSS